MKPDIIITSDMHLRIDTPECRLDDYWQAQSDKLKFIKNLQNKYDIPILDAGDLMHKEENASRRRPPSPQFLTWCIKNLPYIHTIPGNHDIPNKNIVFLEKAGITTLEAAKSIRILKEGKNNINHDINAYAFPWGTDIKKGKDKNLLINNKRNIAVAHYLVYEDKPFWAEDIVSTKGISLLKKLKDFDLIITGHNHQSFMVEYKGRVLLNPGSMMRMYADQINYEPKVFLYYAEDNTIKPISLPIKKDAVTRAHIEEKHAKNERLDALINRFKDDYELSLSFGKNIEKFLSENKIRKSVETIIMELTT